MNFELYPLKRLGDVALGKMVQYGPGEDGDVSAPYLRAAHIQPLGQILDLDEQPMWFSRAELAKLTLERGDVVIVEGGAGFGRSACLAADRPGWGFQNSIVRVRAHSDRATGRFLNYAVQSAQLSGEIDIACNTATLPHFTAEKVAVLPVPAPPVWLQERIADFLDRETAEIDAFIADQEELIALLAERRKAVLDRIAGVTSNYRTVRLRYLFAQSREDNRPELDVLSVYREYGVILKSSRSDNFNKTPEDLSRYLEVRPGWVVVNKMKAWQGSLGVSNFTGIVSPDYEVLRPTSKQLLQSYVHQYLRSPRMVAEYAVRSVGIRPSQWRLYWDALKNLQVPVPPMEVQARIVKAVGDETAEIDATIADATEAIALSRERRAALISAAVTGKIDVRDEARETA